MPWKALLCVAAVTLAACGTGDSEGGHAAASVSDPATAILGSWEWGNEVGSLTYRFTVDGSVRVTSRNKFQTLEAGGSWEAVGDQIVVRMEGLEAGDEAETVRFLDGNHISVASPAGEHAYARVDGRS